MTRVVNLEYKLWDVKNISASDFTVELTIKDRMWASYKNRKKADASFPDFD